LQRDEQGIEQPTRFRLRIVSRGSRRSGRPTPVRISPLIGPATSGLPPAEAGGDCDRDEISNAAESDDDNDLMSDALELDLGLDSCSPDTDGDQMQDAFEYWSAKDLNHKAVPYPGKKPYPNPLDASDGAIDFDGDTLTAGEEHFLWQRTGRDLLLANAGSADLTSPLSYSAGTRTSRPYETPVVPRFRSADYGRPFTSPAYPQAYVIRDDGVWGDDERDADEDGLNNYIETHGWALQAWWRAKFSEDNVKPWPYRVVVTDEGSTVEGSYYGEFNERPFADPFYVDGDSDGDTLLDAEDDQDNDDWSNIDEMEYGKQVPSRDESGAPATRYVNPYNPCAPDGQSRTCPPYRPIGG
jgi:hypothetical protein